MRMIRLLALVAVGVVCATAASAANAPSGLIVFSSASGLGGKTQIWVMSANGTGRHAVSPPTSSYDGPALSPDGKRIAVGAHGHIYVMTVRGSGVRRLTSGSGELSPAWSPNGRWIAYARPGAGKSAIWKMRADGSHKTRLTPASLSDVPDWSPDGRRIAYAEQGRIWVMNADGTGRHAVTKTVYGVDWAPSWSRDGRRIAYESNRATSPVNPTNEIWLMNADGSNERRLTHNNLQDGQPTWSPDGNWIGFTSQLPYPGTMHIWVMHPSGKNLHRVSSASSEEYYPSWSR
jgi:TolB protein